MTKNTPELPAFKRHKATGQGYANIDGKRRYFGRYDLPESRARYDVFIAGWLANGRRTKLETSDATIVEVVAAFKAHVERTYNDDRTVIRFRMAWEPLANLFGHTPAAEFGPRTLKALRQHFIGCGKRPRSRQYVNTLVGSVKHLFKWAASEELVPASVFHGLQTVAGLRHGRTEAHETTAIKPVPIAHVDATKPFLSRPAAALVDLLALTGARPGELCIMRAIDINMSGKVWEYRPATHKTAHRGFTRTIYLGPKAQEIVRPFLANRPVEAFLFSPAEAVAEQRERRHEERVTPQEQGNNIGTNRKRRPRKEPGDRYTVRSLYGAVQYAIGKAGVPRWTLYQLRHLVATEVRRDFGIDEAAALLGHRDTKITERYAELNQSKAAAVMAKVG